MIDLFVLTADADAQAVLSEVLSRHQALSIRPITFKVDRHVMRDAGIITDGPELVRLLDKSDFRRILLLWDYHGCGRTEKPTEIEENIRNRLIQATWRDRSDAFAIDPELEERIWHGPASLAKHLRIPASSLASWISDPKIPSVQEHPREALEAVFVRVFQRKPLPGDFKKIAAAASLRQWQSSRSFGALVALLRSWFPPESP